MSRCRFILAGAAALVLAACSSSDIAAPSRSLTPTPAERGVVPGSNGNGSNSSGALKALPCNVLSPINGSARIGPSGGVLYMGPHRLIVPPGALTKDTTITGTVSSGSATLGSVPSGVVIEFQPTGLHFKKPAGLIFDASSCGPVPDAVYLNPLTGGGDPIQAIYSNWWHTIAAPIEHFSIYALDV